MIPQVKYEQTLTSGNMVSSEASIEMTPEMYELLSSGVYTDKIMAVIREVICNARDAQVVSGTSKGIYVHIPTRFSPFFSVRDYGTGLTEQEIMQLYLRYGHSDKRGSNDLIGGLGIGSKSPLAYTDSFIVSSVVNGVKTTYNIFKEKGIPKVVKLNSLLTLEDNGIEVKVSVRSHEIDEFSRKFVKFCSFFDYKVESNVTLPPKVTPTLSSGDFEFYKDGIRYFENGTYARMAGVLYKISKEHNALSFTRDYRHSSITILNFNVGELSVAASRESLSENDETVKNIISKKNLVEKEYLKVIEKSATSEKTLATFLKVLVTTNHINTNFSSYTKDVANFKFNNETVAEISDKVKDLQFRTIFRYIRKNADGFSHISSVHPDVTYYLYDDGCKGILKLARYLSNNSNLSFGKIVILSSESEVKLLEWMYGKGNIILHKSSAEYIKAFPKGSKVINTQKLGIYTCFGEEVKTLKEDTEGFYLVYNNHEREINKLTTDEKEVPLHSFDDTCRALKWITKQTKKEVNIYLCRKGGLKAIKKTKLKLLHESELQEYIEKLFAPEQKNDILHLTLVNALEADSLKPLASLLAELAKRGNTKNLFNKEENMIFNSLYLGYNKGNLTSLGKNTWYTHEIKLLAKILFGDNLISAITTVKEKIRSVREGFPLANVYTTYLNNRPFIEHYEMYINTVINNTTKEES